MLGEMQVSDLSWSCKEFVRKYSEVFDRVGSCEEFGRRIARYSIELGVVRRMLGEM